MSLRSLFLKDNPGSLIGQRFHRWVVTGPLKKKSDGFIYAPARCYCGTLRDVREYTLRKGLSKSCGCYSLEVTRSRGSKTKTHGMSKTLIYNTWEQMIGRCHNPKSKDFPRYGGRGITVCDRWRSGFVYFYSDIGDRPEGKSLDRIDNDKGYSPDNCRWATPVEQAHNSRAVVNATINGKTQCIAAWLREFGLKKITYQGRRKRGWSIEEALTTPTDQRFNWQKGVS